MLEEAQAVFLGGTGFEMLSSGIGALLYFGAQSSKKGLAPKLRRDLVVWMSIPAHGIRGKDQKKIFIAKSKALP